MWVGLDLAGEEGFAEVEVDSEADWDDAGEEEHVAEVVDWP